MENISTKDMETLLSSVFVEQEKMRYYKIVDNIITQHEGTTEIKDGKLRINYSSGPFILDSAGLKQNKVSIRIIDNLTRKLSALAGDESFLIDRN